MSSTPSHIQQVHATDWRLWKHIRLEALKLHPEAFGGSYEEESLWSAKEFKKTLVKSDVFGAFVNNKLVGVAGFFIYGLEKLKHRGMLFTLYVKEEHRSIGIANQLLETVIEHARIRVLQLHCTVNKENKSAIKLYQRHGFQIYGTAPRTLKLGEKFYDEHLMVLRFD